MWRNCALLTGLLLAAGAASAQSEELAVMSRGIDCEDDKPLNAL